MAWTKEERAAYVREYYLKNAEKIKERMRDYNRQNKEWISLKNKPRTKARWDKIKEEKDKYNKEHYSEIILIKQIKAIESKIKEKEYIKEWRVNNPDKIKDIKKKDYEKNKDRINKRKQDKWKKDKETLADAYIIKVLKNEGWNLQSIKEYPILIEIKRLIIKTEQFKSNDHENN
jgi:hypothetical protein